MKYTLFRFIKTYLSTFGSNQYFEVIFNLFSIKSFKFTFSFHKFDDGIKLSFREKSNHTVVKIRSPNNHRRNNFKLWLFQKDMFTVTYLDIKISKNKNEPARPVRSSWASKLSRKYIISIDREQF